MSKNIEEVYLETTLTAGIDHVFNTLLSNDTYSYWAAAFGGENSYEGIIGLGEKIIFKSKDSDGTVYENYATVTKFEDNKIIEFGFYADDFQSELTSHFERYEFSKIDDSNTQLTVVYNSEVDNESQSIKYLKEAFRLMEEWYKLGR